MISFFEDLEFDSYRVDGLDLFSGFPASSRLFLIADSFNQNIFEAITSLGRYLSRPEVYFVDAALNGSGFKTI